MSTQEERERSAGVDAVAPAMGLISTLVARKAALKKDEEADRQRVDAMLPALVAWARAFVTRSNSDQPTAQRQPVVSRPRQTQG